MLNRLQLIASFILGSLFTVYGQTGTSAPIIKMTKVEAEAGGRNLKINLLAKDERDQPLTELTADLIRISEQIESSIPTELDIIRLVPNAQYDTIDLQQEALTVVFLIDQGNQMQQKDLDRAREIVQAFFDQYDLGKNTSYFWQSFGFEEAETVKIDKNTVNLPVLKSSKDSPNLYYAINLSLKELNRLPGRKLLFVLTNGRNSIVDNPRYTNSFMIPPHQNEVFQIVKNLSNKQYIFPIALGDNPDISFLSELARQSPQSLDVLSKDNLPTKKIDEIIKGNYQLVSTHSLELRTKEPIFYGRNRSYLLEEKGNPAQNHRLEYKKGSLNSPVVLDARASSQDYPFAIFLGLLILLLLLGIFSLLVPILRRQQFIRRHVKAYQAQAGRRVTDIWTREPIRDGEMVVEKCKKTVLLETWKDVGWQCPHYDKCTQNAIQCNGAGAPENDNFFGLQGIYRRLNWVWFGATGGFIGWLLYAGQTNFAANLNQILTDWAIGLFTPKEEYLANLISLVGDALIGCAFGMGIILMLSFIEERGQSRQFSKGRILLRTILGGLVAMLAFGGGFALHTVNIIESPIFAALFAWWFFGIGLGWVLSIKSSINLRRGLLGGSIAGLIGFGVYLLISNLSLDYTLAKLLSILLTGALLGLVLDTVIHRLESFEIEYLTPSKYRRTVPISKWLNNQMEIYVGTQPGSHVYIKWTDEDVEPEHAKLALDGGTVYLTPLAETLINGRIKQNHKRIPLKKGDTIQLGRRGVTKMRFQENNTPVRVAQSKRSINQSKAK